MDWLNANEILLTEASPAFELASSVGRIHSLFDLARWLDGRSIQVLQSNIVSGRSTTNG
jgi:hypothetical protein